MPTDQAAAINALIPTKETGPIFQENWFSDRAIRELLACVKRTEGVPGAVIEVGSWEGKSSIPLANAIYPALLYAVDTWRGNEKENEEIEKRGDGSQHPTTVEIQHGRDIKKRFLQNIGVATKGNVKACHISWQEYICTYRPQIRLIFIDADHTYQETYDLISWAKGQIAPGGIICGDDFYTADVQRAVLELLPECHAESIWVWQNPK